MALLQALISFVGKSARRVLNSLFGWAVVALFGRSAPKQHLFLMFLVAAAALWPLLVAGVVFPKIAAFVFAFVPFSGDTATVVLRVFWIVLAVAVPATLGITMATKAPPGTQAEPFAVRMLRGFPMTLGVAAALHWSACSLRGESGVAIGSAARRVAASS